MWFRNRRQRVRIAQMGSRNNSSAAYGDRPPSSVSQSGLDSASPFEGLAERMNWLERPLAEDPFGKALLAAGISEEMLQSWMVDPRVPMPDGGQGSLFDALEDLDLDACVAKAVEISKAAPA